MAGSVHTVHNQPPLATDNILPQDAREIANREWERLTEELAHVRADITELQCREEALETQVRAWSVILSIGGADPDRQVHEVSDMDSEDATLPTPQESADAVVELLRATGEPMHYRRIYDILHARGMEVRGKNPPNTLLARFFDDPRLERVGQGTYRIKEVEEVYSSEQ